MSDLISRQDAIEVINGVRIRAMDNGDDVSRIWECADAILQMHSDKSKIGKWIPCSERMPKVRTDVLLMFEDNMAVGFYSHGDWNVNTGNNLYVGILDSEEAPIAWMPLLEPYREGDKE